MYREGREWISGLMRWLEKESLSEVGMFKQHERRESALQR